MNGNVAVISGAVGTLLPLLIALINQRHWSAALKALTAFGLSVPAGAATAWAAGSLTGTDVVGAIVIVFGAAVGTYKAYWQPSGIAPAVERATTPGGGT